MRGWVDIAYLAKPKNLNGGLVARGAAGLPLVLREGLALAVVPPQIDAPRTLTVTRVEERTEAEALVFFREVPDLSTAERLGGCRLLAREDEVDLSVLEEAAELPDWEGWRLLDADGTEVGEVAAIDERASQPLITVRRPNGDEALVPLAEELLEEVEEDTRLIRMHIPAGLLDL